MATFKHVLPMATFKHILETSEQGRREFLKLLCQMLMAFENSNKLILTSTLNIRPLNKSFE